MCPTMCTVASAPTVYRLGFFLQRCRLFFWDSAEILLDKNAAWSDLDKNIQIEYKVDEVGIGKPIDIPAGSSSCQFIDNQDREVFSHPLITSYVW